MKPRFYTTIQAKYQTASQKGGFVRAHRTPSGSPPLSIALTCCLFTTLMATSESIARMLSGLDPSDLMGGDQEALTDFIANYLEQGESPQGKLP